MPFPSLGMGEVEDHYIRLFRHSWWAGFPRVPIRCEHPTTA